MGTSLGFGIQGRRAIVDRDSARGWLFVLSRKYEVVHQNLKTHADEILTILFFTRDVKIVFH